VIVIVVLAALGWVSWAFLVRPAKHRQRSHQAMQDAVVAGDEIITAGGLHAVVREAEDDALRIEVAPGVVVTLDRRAVAAVAVEEPADAPAAELDVEPASEADPAPDAAHDLRPESS
jgi:preprotein translocase subunit YajC